jgi:YHS domain-containing protein
MNSGDIHLYIMFGTAMIIFSLLWVYIFISGILEDRKEEKERRKKYLCSWCNQSLSDNQKYDVFIMYRGSDWIFCSWKCAYQFIKNEIIHTV